MQSRVSKPKVSIKAAPKTKRRAAEHLRTIALVALSDDVPLALFAEDLVQEIRDQNSTAIHLTAEVVVERTGIDPNSEVGLVYPPPPPSPSYIRQPPRVPVTI